GRIGGPARAGPLVCNRSSGRPRNADAAWAGQRSPGVGSRGSVRPGARLVHVLLIEDDPRIQEIVERGLGARGFTVIRASDGPSGVELTQKLAVDLVLLDLKLPGMPGVEVLERIRAAKPRLPVIVLT